MNSTGVQDRNGKLVEYLELLRSLAQELECSMQAISQNSLSLLEDSVANQQILATRLHELANDLSKPVEDRSVASPGVGDEGLMGEIRGASKTLQALNQRYAALLKLSSHSVGLMVALFSSFRGQIQEGTGPRLEHQTWSCQV